MESMEKIAKKFQNDHKKGVVSDVTSYSFKYTEGKDSVIYMLSWFLELKSC